MIEATAHCLDRLAATIIAKRNSDPGQSYTAQLFAAGLPKIARKVGEEAIETMIEALEHNHDRLISESADLLYHLLVLWAASGVVPSAVWSELERRSATSGIGQTNREEVSYDL